MKTKILGIIVVLVLNTNLFAHEFNGKILATLKVQNPVTAIMTLKKHAIDIAAVSRSEKIVDVVINDLEFKKLKQLGFEPEILLVKGVTRGPDERYKKPHDIERLLKDFNAAYPELTELISIGKSLEGRDIWAMRITGPNKQDKPVVLFNGMHHAREVMTPEIVLDITEYLLTKYSTDTEVKSWVDGLEVWVLPMLNVDGNQKMWTDDSMWRKNARGGFGVDINRNYPVGWNSCNGSSGRTWAQDYRGESPASEPETQVMMSFVTKIRPVFNISYHSYSELVIFPYGCSPKNAKGMVEKIGHELGKALDYKAGTAWELLYNADGGDIDWMYHDLGVLPYVIEVNDRWAGFQPNFELWRDETVEKNRSGWKLLMNKALGAGLKGQYRGEKAKSLEVYKNDKLFMTYPLLENGKFHLVLEPGVVEIRGVDEKKNIILKKTITVSEKLNSEVLLRD